MRPEVAACGPGARSWCPAAGDDWGPAGVGHSAELRGATGASVFRAAARPRGQPRAGLPRWGVSRRPGWRVTRARRSAGRPGRRGHRLLGGSAVPAGREDGGLLSRNERWPSGRGSHRPAGGVVRARRFATRGVVRAGWGVVRAAGAWSGPVPPGAWSGRPGGIRPAVQVRRAAVQVGRAGRRGAVRLSRPTARRAGGLACWRRGAGLGASSWALAGSAGIT